MPPKKNINKAREPVTSTTKSLGTRQVKNNSLSGQKDASGKTYKKAIQKKTKDDNLLSKKDINIMLANEVLKTQLPSKMPFLDAIERTIVEESDVPKRIIKKIQTVPLKQKPTVKKKITKRKIFKKKLLSNEETYSNTTEQEDNKEAVSKIASMKIRRIRKLYLKKNQTQGKQLQEDKPKCNKEKLVPPKLEKKIVRRGRPKKKNIQEISSIEEQKTEIPVEIMKSPLPVKRKKNIPNNISRSSSCSDLSWTRDISSCSTSCISVSSNDFVLIDNKLPVIKLKNINPKPGPKSFKKTFKHTTENIRKSIEIKKNDEKLYKVIPDEESFQKSEPDILDSNLAPPVLSSSSSSSNSSSSTSLTDNTSCVSNNNNIKDLFTKLRSVDLEVIAWVGFNNINSCSTPKLDQFKEKLESCNVLREERSLLQRLKTIQKQLHKYRKNDDSDQISEKENKNSSQEDVTFLKPSRVSQPNYKNRVSQIESTPEKPTQSSDILANQSTSSNLEACNNSSKCQDDNDDDDALSLYAESITGLDSSRKSSSIQHVTDARHEEYTPEYISKKVPVTFYKPSRIEISHETEPKEVEQEIQNNIVTAVCEKQNADSTSLNKELENNKTATEKAIIFEDRRGDIEKTNFDANLYNATKPTYPSHARLIEQNYKSIRRTRSAVFNICYYNLDSRCLNNNNCKFHHFIPSREEIENKVSCLDEETFVAEYMLMRGVYSIRRKYGICFVNDCIRRKLTRLLVEMVKDFVLKGDYNNSEDNALTTDVVERTMLYLNNVDLNVCRDILTFKLNKYKGLLLCNYLLKFIAESPNFTRFIPIFIKLACFISSMDLRFDIQVSTMLLERVCILPYEDKLARALIEVMKNTNDTIFSNHMVEKFENILMNSNKDLYDSFAFLKKRKILNQTITNGCNGAGHLENDIRYSPDTTNLDNFNKTMEPKLTRTIENNVSSQYANGLSSKSMFQEDWNLPSSSRCGPTSFGLNGQFHSTKASTFPTGLNLQCGYKRKLDLPFSGNHLNKIRRTIDGEHVNLMRAASNSSSGSEDRHPGGPRARGSPFASRRTTRRMPMNRSGRNDGPRYF